MYSLRYDDSLYLDDEKTKPWPRIFSCEQNQTLFISGSDGAISFPKISSSLKFGNYCLIDSYSNFVLNDSTTFFYNKSTPFSNAVNLSIKQGGTEKSNSSITIGYQDTIKDFSAFNHLETIEGINCGLSYGLVYYTYGSFFGDQTTAIEKVGDTAGSMKYPLKSLKFKGGKDFSFSIIAANAFSNLSSLESVYVDSGSGSLRIGTGCFQNCTSLKTFSIVSKSGFGFNCDSGILSGCTSFNSLHNSISNAFNLPEYMRFNFASSSTLPFDSDIYVNIIGGSTCYTQFKAKYGSSTFVSSGHVLVNGVQVFSLA
jgi:hypothetical protein